MPIQTAQEVEQTPRGRIITAQEQQTGVLQGQRPQQQIREYPTISQLRRQGFIIEKKGDRVIAKAPSKTVFSGRDPNNPVKQKYSPIEYRFYGDRVIKVERKATRNPQSKTGRYDIYVSERETYQEGRLVQEDRYSLSRGRPFLSKSTTFKDGQKIREVREQAQKGTFAGRTVKDFITGQETTTKRGFKQPQLFSGETIKSLQFGLKKKLDLGLGPKKPKVKIIQKEDKLFLQQPKKTEAEILKVETTKKQPIFQQPQTPQKSFLQNLFSIKPIDTIKSFESKFISPFISERFKLFSLGAITTTPKGPSAIEGLSKKELSSKIVEATGDFISKPITQVTPEVATGGLTSGFIRMGIKTLTRSKTILKFLGSKKGIITRKISSAGLFGTFGILEARRIQKAEDPTKEVLQIPLRFGAFGTGADIETRLATSVAARRRITEPFSELQREEQLQKSFKEPEFQEQIRELIKIQKQLRKKPETPKPITKQQLPKDIPKKSKVLQTIKEEKGVFFGSLVTQTRPAGDIDVAAQQAKILQTKLGKVTGAEQRGQAIGFEDFKVADVKPLSRLYEFPFIEPLVVGKTGIRQTRQSEQLARKIGGVVQRREKAAKDLDDTFAIIEDLTKQNVKKLTPKKAKSFENIRKKSTQLKKQSSKLKKELQKTKPSKKKPSDLPSSKLPSRLPSRLPSSFLPSKFPSKVSKFTPSKIPSRIPIPKSKITTSLIPPSKIPPIKPPSKIPPTKTPPSLLPPIKPPPSLLPPIKPPSKIPPTKTPPSLIPPLRPPKDTRSFPEERQFETGFQAFIRRAGEFIPVGKPLPKSEAIRFGAQRVERTAAATFIIRPTSQFVRRSQFKQPSFDRRRFRTKIGAQGEKQFIERRRFRISTGGEIAQITMKGLDALSKKRIF